MYLATPSQMKSAEANAVAAGKTYIGLMENAGAAAVQELCRCVDINADSRVLIICGRGNNGGDGFVMARLIADMGARVFVTLPCGAPKSGIALEEYAKIAHSKITFLDTDDERISDRYDAVVDAVFGTGFHGELSADIISLFSRISKDSFILAADIPSGADSVTGKVSAGTLMCGLTITFGAPKIGMTLLPAQINCGKIIVREIGITESCFENTGAPIMMTDAMAEKCVPARGQSCHKGTFGRLLIIAGSENMSGAAAMNLKAALRSGAGLVKLASVPAVIDRAAAGIYEATFCTLSANESGAISSDGLTKLCSAAENMTVIAMGSGLSCCDDTKELVRGMISFCGEKNIPLILDADGLNCIADSIDIIRNANCKAVLTPHVGELARLLGMTAAEVMADRLSAAAALSEKTGAVVVAKGVPTYIVSPKKRCASYSGNGGLSRGGSGDVLTGIISGICSMNRGERLYECVCAAVHIFGIAADMAAEKLSMSGMLPTDVIAQLPFAFKQIRPEKMCRFSAEYRR